MGSNRFFDVVGSDKEPTSGRVYAAIEAPEEGEPVRGELSEPVLLECIDSHWVHSRHPWSESFRKAPLSVLELVDYPLPPLPPGIAPGEIAWFQFGYEPAKVSPPDARTYRGLFSGGSPVKIEFHEPRPLGWSPGELLGGGPAWLDMPPAPQTPDHENDREILSDILRELDRSFGVAVYDVGQGNCQALLHPDLQVPLLYVDLGGGVCWNSKTYPKKAKGLCFSQSPIIVLSHWDWDHWSSAYRSPLALTRPWVAPRVPLLPIQRAFAAELYTRGLLHIWDDTWPGTLHEGAVRIERCTGRTSNDSGLAVTLYRRNIGRTNCLLPGDAAYRYVPSVMAQETFSYLCLTHHGGRLHSSDYPRPRRRTSPSVLSVGPANSYCHPLFGTIAAHLKSGWALPVHTALSGDRPCHVLLPWGEAPRIFTGGCHGEGCSVAIAAIAPALDHPELRLPPPTIEGKRVSKTPVSV